MPNCLNAAVQALTGEGVALDVARRAAVAALWMETGRLPSPGLETDVDLLPRAREFLALAEANEVTILQASGDLEDLATFAETDAPAASPSPRILREAHLLHPGTFNGHTFTEADLQELVDNFNAQDPPPIQLDHSSSARDTQGYVRGLRMSGDKLRALLEFRGQEAVQKVTDGLWRKLSAGIYLKPRKRVKEVSATPFPAVSGPEPARVLSEGGSSMTINTPAEETAQTTTETPVELQETETPVEPEVVAETPPQDPPPTLADDAEVQSQAILAAHEAEIARLTAELESQQKIVRLKEDTDLVATFVRDGRSTPALAAAELKFVQALAPEQRSAYVALKQQAPTYVTMGRRSLPTVHQDGVKSPQAEQAETEALLSEAGYKKGEDGRWTR